MSGDFLVKRENKFHALYNSLHFSRNYKQIPGIHEKQFKPGIHHYLILLTKYFGQGIIHMQKIWSWSSYHPSIPRVAELKNIIHLWKS